MSTRDVVSSSIWEGTMNFARRHFLLAASAAVVSTVPHTAKAQPAALESIIWGAGPRMVFVHGSILNGPLTWRAQRPLAQRWMLEVINRRGYGNSPAPAVRSDFEEDARDIAALLGDGAHLVGHSYGAIGALYAAALRPQAVRSLAVNEPPAFRLLKGDAEADAIVKAQAALRRDVEPRAFVEAFLKTIAAPGEPPPRQLADPLPPGVVQGARTTMLARPQGDAEIPLDALRPTSFPKLVISGGHHPVFEGICDKLHRELNTQRVIIPGAGHNVPFTGAPFNEHLEAFLKSS